MNVSMKKRVSVLITRTGIKKSLLYFKHLLHKYYSWYRHVLKNCSPYLIMHFNMCSVARVTSKRWSSTSPWSPLLNIRYPCLQRFNLRKWWTNTFVFRITPISKKKSRGVMSGEYGSHGVGESLRVHRRKFAFMTWLTTTPWLAVRHLTGKTVPSLTVTSEFLSWNHKTHTDLLLHRRHLDTGEFTTYTEKTMRST